MSDQPVEILGRERMGRAQIVVIVLCVLLNGLDGFDVLSISFAAPGIAEEWGISRGALGLVLAMELIGMAVGSIILGQAADRIGRRPIIIASLCVMASGMFLAATANSVEVMSGYRLFTGLGIGGMLACTNAMVAEYSNDRYRSLNVTIMATGYPMGAIIGGAIASQLLAHFDWRAVFIFGGIMTAIMLPAVLIAMPESVSSLAARRPKGALEKINRTLKRLGHSALERLPDLKESAAASGGGGLRRLLGPALITVTLLLTLAYFAHIMTFYYILKWIPKLVVDMGYIPSEAGNVLVWANVGGATGGIVLGLLSRKLDIRWLTITVLGLAFFFVTYFGTGHNTLQALSLVSAMVGFFTNAGVVGLYALIAKYFPADVRAGGTGFVIGIGRGGAALGPIIAGYLFEAGQGLQTVSICMASGAVIAMIALIALGRRSKAVGAA